jgi:hypothetical protein
MQPQPAPCLLLQSSVTLLLLFPFCLFCREAPVPQFHWQTLLPNSGKPGQENSNVLRKRRQHKKRTRQEFLPSWQKSEGRSKKMRSTRRMKARTNPCPLLHKSHSSTRPPLVLRTTAIASPPTGWGVLSGSLSRSWRNCSFPAQRTGKSGRQARNVCSARFPFVPFLFLLCFLVELVTTLSCHLGIFRFLAEFLLFLLTRFAHQGSQCSLDSPCPPVHALRVWAGEEPPRRRSSESPADRQNRFTCLGTMLTCILKLRGRHQCLPPLPKRQGGLLKLRRQPKGLPLPYFPWTMKFRSR